MTVDASFAASIAQAEHAAHRQRSFAEVQQELRGVRGQLFPAVQFPVVAGAVTVPTSVVLLGPEDGQVWDVRRISIAGLTAATGLPTGGNQQGSVTSPAALTNISGNITPSAGTWVLNWQIMLGGTVAIADQNNFGLYQGATQLEVSINPGSVGGPWPQLSRTVATPGGNAYNVKNIAAGTASSVYLPRSSAQPRCPPRPPRLTV